MIEKELIKLLLGKEFYTKNKGRLSKELFTNGTGDLYNTIAKAHLDSENDLSLNEISTLYTDVDNPALTRVAKQNFQSLIEDIESVSLPNEKIANNILESLYKRRQANKIAVLATEIYNGKEADFSEIKKCLESSIDDEGDNYEYITSDVGELVEQLKDNTKFKFNLKPLQERVHGVGEGNLVILFARPESGKTAFWVNLIAGINGFASQGAKVCALINEEPAIRTQMRLINAHTGMTFEEIKNDTALANRKWAEIKENVKILDTVDWDLVKVDELVAQERPDIIVIDQLDKVGVAGNFARTDEKLRAIYTGAREIAKRNNCCVIAISQASADAQGKLDITFDMMENSKTGKAAEADVIIGVGYRDKVDMDKNLRGLNITKNKITGWHGMIPCNIVPELSRYEE